jgi:molybdopterin-guanine dinucleotide biosynthesis protein A
LNNQLTGVILAGGKSQRMGHNKALLRLGNQTIIQRVLARLNQVTSSQFIVTTFPKEYEFLDIPMKPDILPGKGALGGIYTGLFFSETTYCLTVACDMPFLKVDFLQYMAKIVAEPALSETKGYDIVVPNHNKGYEPLCAIYAKTCMPHIAKLLKANRLKIIEFFPHVQVREVGESEIKNYGQNDLMFFNINTQEDYQQAIQIYNQKKKFT